MGFFYILPQTLVWVWGRKEVSFHHPAGCLQKEPHLRSKEYRQRKKWTHGTTPQKFKNGHHKCHKHRMVRFILQQPEGDVLICRNNPPSVSCFCAHSPKRAEIGQRWSNTDYFPDGNIKATLNNTADSQIGNIYSGGNPSAQEY